MALLSLAIGSFGIGMTEFVAMGLLPDIAREVMPTLWASSQDEALGKAGWLITLYALGVVVGAPTIAGMVAKYPRHRVMLGLAFALTVFNALTVVMPTFELIAASRFLAGLPHGAYFGIGALVAADVMGPGNRAKGVAFIISGLTLANVVGVPLGTLLGQQWGWRAAFLVVTIVFAVATISIALCVPHQAGSPGRTLRAELGVFRVTQVWFALAIGAIGFGGFFAMYSYIAPVITEVAGSPTWSVPMVLVLIGLGMTIGNLVGGHFADIDKRRTMFVGLGGMAVALVLMWLLAASIVALCVLVFAVGFFAFVMSPAIQTRLMDVAGDYQAIAAALNHSALNVGNSLGAFLGGVVIASGFGLVSPAWVGASLALAGLIIALIAYTVEGRQQAKLSVA